jgi:transcriptional regulator with XRE-family HTH domain
MSRRDGKALDQLLTNIRLQIARLNWKQNKLARESGISAVTICHLLNKQIKHPSLATIKALARAMKCKESDLTSADND